MSDVVYSMNSVIPIGYVGENETREIAIDIRPLIRAWPDLAPVLLAKRPGENALYPCVTHVENGVLYWRVTLSDTAIPGKGECVIHMIDGEGRVGKSRTMTTMIERSASGGEMQEPPEAIRPWIDDVLASIESVKEGYIEIEQGEENAGFVLAVGEDGRVTLKKGGSGGDGVGVESVEQTQESTESGGENVWTLRLTDGTTSRLIVRNGSRGAQGERGERGIQGERGQSGEAGPAGPQGPAGETGPAGPQGERGPAGERGEQGERGAPFAIAKIYPSQDAMNAGYATDGVAVGGFVLIETGNVNDEENARLYVKGESRYEYVTDLSGAPGIQGPAGKQGPQGPAGNPGAAGADGKDGTSVTIKSVSESSADGGSNVVTFSDGKTVTIKNGKTGAQGPMGPTGETGPAGPTGPAGADGKDGAQGPAGPAGSDATVTATNIQAALGYKPASEASVSQLSEKIANVSSHVNPKKYGAKGDGATDDTIAFQNALANADVVNVTKGTYVLSDTIIIRSGCKMVLDRDVHLKFNQTDKHCIVMQKFAILDGGNGSISVQEGFANGVIVFDSSLDGTNKADVFPYKNWSPMQKYGRTVRNLDIVRELPNGKLESSDGSCSGTAIYLHASNETNHDFLWACIIDHVNICGAFSYGIRAKNEGGWLHDTKMESVYIDACEVGVSLENMHHTYVDCIIQPRAALNDVKYAKHGLKLVNSQHCMALGLKVWDWQVADDSDSKNTHIAMYGDCCDFVFADIYYDNYSKASEYWASIYTDTPSNYENATLINEPNNKWFYNDADVPYFRKYGGVARLATYAELESNFGTTIVPNFKDWLAAAIEKDKTIYNGIGYKKGYRIDSTSGEEVKMSDDTYTVTGFIPVKNTDVIRFENLSMWIDGFCGYVVYDDSFNRITHLGAQALANDASYREVVVNENGNVVSFALKSAAGAAYIRFTLGTGHIFKNPMVAINEEITYSTYGSLSPDIAVNYHSLINVPEPQDLSIYQSKNIVDSGGYFGADTVDGALQEIGGLLDGLTEALEGLL